MIILHCLKETEWKECKNEKFYGNKYIERGGFIHCSDVHTFHRVASNFSDVSEPLVLLCIDTSKVQAKIRWEDNDNCGTEYPHIYGLLNLDSVTDVFPFIKDGNGTFVLNKELQ